LLHHASKELIAAISFYQKMIKSQLTDDFATFDMYWREFLQKLERTWNKAEAAVAGRNDCKLILDAAKNLRKNDDLLCYLRHARNADEHTVSEIAKEWDGNLRAKATGAVEFVLEWDSWDRHLLPVTNRGVTYQPARVHLGVSFAERIGQGTAEPIVVADLAMHYYLNLINQLNSQVLLKDTRND